MSLNTINPIVLINNKQIKYSSITYKKTSIHNVSQLSITSGDINLKIQELHRKEILLFLNIGSGKDNIPFFRGYVTSVKPNTSGINIEALDCLQFLTGEFSQLISVNDNNNYDGMTLGQFLHHYINKYVNVDKTLLGVDLLNDTNPPKSLSGYRNKEYISALKIIKDNPVSDNSKVWDNDTSDSTSLPWFIDVIDDGVNSNIMFKKLQSRTPDVIKQAVPFSMKDGINSFTVREQPPINTVVIIDAKTGNRTSLKTHEHKSVKSSTQYKAEFDYPDEARKDAHLIISNSRNNNKEIKITVTKGHYLEVGTFINIKERAEPSINGYHNIIGKELKISGNSITCHFTLDKPKPILSDYLSIGTSIYH